MSSDRISKKNIRNINYFRDVITLFSAIHIILTLQFFYLVTFFLPLPFLSWNIIEKLS